jgi:hypothetical protein
MLITLFNSEVENLCKYQQKCYLALFKKNE